MKLGAAEAVNQEEGDRVERAITTDASLKATHDKGHTSRSGEDRLEENIELTDTVPKPYDLPLIGGYTPRSDEGMITLAKLMETCTILSNRVTQLVTKLLTTKVVYNKAFITLTNRVKKLESQLKQKRSKADTGEHSRGDDDETLAKTLLNIKRMSTKDKGKVIMKETELPKKLKKKEMIQLSLDEEPFSKAEVKKNMVMYLKNQGGYKQSYFKRMKYEDIRPLFKRIWDQVHTFVPKDFKIEREVMKRVGFDLKQGVSKKQRLDQQAKETKKETKAQGDSDQEVEELKLYMRIIPKGDIVIEAIPLAIKPLMIIEYKIVKRGKISTYHITRADGSTGRYTSMINLLENIDRENLETLWKLVKDKYGNTRPEEGYKRVVWGDLKVMFEPYIESEIQKSAHLPTATRANDEATKEAMKCLEESSQSVEDKIQET
nr:hypothetical protein [Tanacetum cinerariifolium]